MFRSRTLLLFELAAVCIGVFTGRALSAGGAEQGLRPEDFADRWVLATQKANRGMIERSFLEKAVLVFESAGRVRQVDAAHYAALLEAALAGFRSLQRERGEVEVTPADNPGKGTLLSFTISDRIETPEGYTLRTETREEFELGPGEGSRALRYRSRTLSCETLKKPEPWMNYGGPLGFNGFLVEAHFQAPPEGMWLWVVGMVLALGLFLKVVYELGLGMRRRRTGSPI